VYGNHHGSLRDIEYHQRSSAGDVLLGSPRQKEAGIGEEPGLVDFCHSQTLFPTGTCLLVLLPADVLFSAECEFYIRM